MGRPIVVVGAGIVGLATAYTLLRERPGTPLVVLDKEATVAGHQSGHNSGVLHSGVYYRPGSLKARLCLEGRALMLDYLRAHGLPFRICGKLIVATDPAELPRLAELARRARANGVPGVRSLDGPGMRDLEPEVAGTTALHVPGTGIVDYPAVARSLAEEIGRSGGEVRLTSPVERIRMQANGVEVVTGHESVEGSFLVNAGGLQADRLARLAGLEPLCRIVPFRGEHYVLGARGAGLVRGLVYPVPDPDLPFLGVHLTPRVDGSVEAGPNAVLALAREGYRRSDVDWADLLETLVYPGLLPMARRFWRSSVDEGFRSLSKGLFLRSLQRLLPGLMASDLGPWGSGVRAQALGPGGELFDDFLLLRAARGLHVLNAPSPAATSSLAIGRYLVERIPSMAG